MNDIDKIIASIKLAMANEPQPEQCDNIDACIDRAYRNGKREAFSLVLEFIKIGREEGTLR